MIQILSVGAGGFIGAVLRFLIGKLPFKEMTIFPVNTLLINLIGAFVIGIAAAIGTKHGIENSGIMLFLRVGLCGGFTTFSTFSLESYTLLKAGQKGTAALYILLSVGLCLLGVWLGRLAAIQIYRH